MPFEVKKKGKGNLIRKATYEDIQKKCKLKTREPLDAMLKIEDPLS